MKNYFHYLIMLFTFSGLYFLINGEEAESTKETIYIRREYRNRWPFINYKYSESAENPSIHLYPYRSSPSATATMPNILFVEDYNSTRSRLNRSGFSGGHRKNHLGQPISRKSWRRRTYKLKSSRK